MTATMRKAVEADYAVLPRWLPDRNAVLRWCGRAIPVGVAMAELQSQLDEPDTHQFLWADASALIGFGQFSITSPGTAHLGRVLVDPDFRGHGHGRALCTALIEAARVRGNARAMTVEVMRDHIKARNLCSSFGFQEVRGAGDPPWMLMRYLVRPR
jgi:ribosomal protein S18 acetylase RimI-like enzyme